MARLVNLPQDVLFRLMHELDVVDILNAEMVGIHAKLNFLCSSLY